METWAQQDGSWVETGCAVLGRAAPWCSEHLAGRCFLLWFGFPEAKSQFLPAVPGSRWGSGPAGVEGAANPSAGQTLGWAGGLGVPRLRWERGREIGCCCFLFLQPLLWTTRLRNPEQLLREHHPRPVLCAQGSALQGSREIPSGGGKNNPGSLSVLEAGRGSRVRDRFPFDSSAVEMVTPLSHIKNETL